MIEVERPAEIALKKMHYRPTMLKPRDIFDIAVADSIDHDALVGNLNAISTYDKLCEVLDKKCAHWAEQYLITAHQGKLPEIR